MYYSAIGALAALLLLIENQDVFLNREDSFDRPAWKVYRKFLIAVLAYYITDILWGIIESRKLPGLLFADTTVYFVAMAAGVLYWSYFTVSYLDEDNTFGHFLMDAGRVISGLMTLLTFINILRPVVFTVDSECVYRALPGRYIMLAGQILLLLTISAYTFSSFLRRKDKELPEGGDQESSAQDGRESMQGAAHEDMRRRYRALGAFGIIMAACLFAQLWFPYLPLYAIAYMMGTSLLHTLVLNNEKEEYKRGLEEAGKIRELKETITSLLDNMPGMTFTKDAGTGIYLACNQAFADYAHKPTPDGVAGLTDAQIFDPETAEHFVRDDQMALSMDVPYIFYEDVPDAAGNPRQLQTTKLKYTDALGRQCVLGICQDVTDMVRIQRENATTKEAYEKARSVGIIYTHIAQALARGYTDLYYINLDSEEYIEYRPDEKSGTLAEVRRGWHFFEQCKTEAEQFVHPDDFDNFVEALDRRTLVATLERSKTLVMTYRYLSEDGPIYVTMKVSRMEDDDRYIIMGITNVDEEMKERRLADRMKEEQVAYSRLSVLAGDFISLYVVVPETGRYREFSSTSKYEYFEQAKEGRDFFGVSNEMIEKYCYPEDLGRFRAAFTQENVMAEIERRGIFTLSYRIIRDGVPVYVQLRAGMSEEKEGTRLIVGFIDIDDQVRQEEEYVKSLAQARIEANIDALTGVKNRHSYLLAEERLNEQIAEGRVQEFAIVILDVNDLKTINDTEGHKAGDQYIRDACKVICDVFKRSPVFRVGGDEFAVIAQGNDYACIEELVGRMSDHNAEAARNGGVVIACGMAKSENDSSVAPVFERADQKMYVNKTELKEGAFKEGDFNEAG